MKECTSIQSLLQDEANLVQEYNLLLAGYKHSEHPSDEWTAQLKSLQRQIIDQRTLIQEALDTLEVW